MDIRFQKTRHSRTVARLADLPKDDLPQIVLAGKSNVGKSTLINRLCSQNKLARTSQTPGKTRQLIFYKVDDQAYLVDLPGYGYAATGQDRQKEFSDLTQKYLEQEENLVLLLLLLDIRHLDSKLDQMMLSWLKALDLPFALVLNKCDKLSRSRCLDQKRALERQLREQSLEAKVFLTSGFKGDGVDELRSFLLAALEQLQTAMQREILEVPSVSTAAEPADKAARAEGVTEPTA